jgi:hypothetical protein
MMRLSFATFLLIPSLLVVAWLTAAAKSQPFTAVAILLCGGALTAGFIASAQQHYARPGQQERPLAARGTAVIFRFGIGLPVIAYMIYAAMRMMVAG